ncbi:MAG TPA: cytochrome c biogenesis protein CcdA [Abditibacteriaceae bacterium]|jgi:thiol:disulfide interchange protein DsbD
MRQFFLFLALLFVHSAHAQPKVVAVRAEPSLLALKPGESATLKLQLKIDAAYHINANPASEDGLIPVTVKVAPQNGLSFLAPRYPKAEMKTFGFSDKPLAVLEGNTTIELPLKASAQARSGPVRGSVRYQACDDRSCLLPQEAPFEIKIAVAGSAASAAPATADTPLNAGASVSFAETLRAQHKVAGLPTIVFLDGEGRERSDLRAGEEMSREVFLQKMAALKSGATVESAGGAGGWATRLQSASLLWQLVLVFFGGLLLNLTPCVYPMIPITIGYFGAQSEGKASRTFWLAALYVLGLALVYSALGVSAALTGSLFGQLMQSPWVVGAVALVLAILGLGMAGLFTIQPPSWALQRSGGKKGGWGALGMGALLGIVAAPCVGPAVAALLAYVGAKQNPVLGFALFFSLSLGLGLPYLLLGALGGSLKSLPRSGVWLVKAKKFFAVPILAAAAYFAWSAWNAAQLSSATTKGAWPHATQVKLEEARAAKRAVVLDYRADWCIPCRKMEHEIFARADVKQAAREANIELLQVDLTRSSQ